MKILDSRLQEVASLMRKIYAESKRAKTPKLTRDQLEKGVRSSRASAVQPVQVNMTPLMKNAMELYGDRTDKRLTVNDPMTKAEKRIVANIERLLLKCNGNSRVFDTSLPIDDKRHYDVQCWQNFKTNMRDIQPGQQKQREKMAKLYRSAALPSVEDIINKMFSTPMFQKAILMVLDQMPQVRASEDIVEINLPFMTKHSGVGFPYWSNDRTIDHATGKTFAEVTMDEAKRVQYNYNAWDDYNVSTMYGRNQRGKGRLLIAVSRILNLLLNMIESVEIEKYKEDFPLFVGYRNDEALKQALIEVTEYCKREGLMCANEDYSSFDSTVGSGMLALIGALSIMKANGARSKRIAMKRAVYAQKTQLVDGITGEVYEVLGRIFSGFIDTNRGGGLANAIAMTTACMEQDPSYSKLAYDCKHYMMVMGDDNLHIYRVLNRERLARFMKDFFGMIINQEKFEFGPVFLQYRLFRDDNDEYVMTYAWTRVVRSMFFTEEAKGLGPVGWTYSFYQKLSKLMDYRPAFRLAVNLIIKFDKNKLFINTPIKELNRMLKEEDEAALRAAKTEAQKRRHSSTVDKLYNGDPTRSRLDNMLTETDDTGIMGKIQAMIREVYEPDFYQREGLV